MGPEVIRERLPERYAYSMPNGASFISNERETGVCHGGGFASVSADEYRLMAMTLGPRLKS